MSLKSKLVGLLMNFRRELSEFDPNNFYSKGMPVGQSEKSIKDKDNLAACQLYSELDTHIE